MTLIETVVALLFVPISALLIALWVVGENRKTGARLRDHGSTSPRARD